MEQRVDISQVAPEGYRAVFALERHVRSAVPSGLLELVKLRASFLNGCAFCIDMHSTDARDAGEDVRRLFAVAAWEESPWFSDDERVALALTDAVTRLEGGVDDDLWTTAVKAFGEPLTAELVLAISTINVWNRLALSTHLQPPALVP